jgi:hypothetical protein
MATLKAVVRKQRADRFFSVYIHIVHRQRMGSIKTDKIITRKFISKTESITGLVMNKYCADLILHYSDLLNRHDIVISKF